MPSVFHYTDSVGLLGILSANSLFATDHRYLNDVSEGGMIRDLILPIFQAEIAEVMPKLVDNGLFEGFYEYHGARANQLTAEGFYRSLLNLMEAHTPLFVLSFCRHKEPKTIQHGLLSQWRAYAGSAGFAIEFDELGLGELIDAEVATFAYSLIKPGDVRYKGYDDLLDPEVYRGVAGEFIRVMLEPRDVSEITGRKEIDPVIRTFARTAPFLKHDGFEEEREYRIVAACIRRDKIPPGVKLGAKEIKFRSKDGLIVPYIELFKGSPRGLPITSIIVGPHPSQEKQAEAVRMALESTPFSKAKVRLSAIPLRR
jgi:hypothetical protein